MVNRCLPTVFNLLLILTFVSDNTGGPLGKAALTEFDVGVFNEKGVGSENDVQGSGDGFSGFFANFTAEELEKQEIFEELMSEALLVVEQHSRGFREEVLDLRKILKFNLYQPLEVLDAKLDNVVVRSFEQRKSELKSRSAAFEANVGKLAALKPVSVEDVKALPNGTFKILASTEGVQFASPVHATNTNFTNETTISNLTNEVAIKGVVYEGVANETLIDGDLINGNPISGLINNRIKRDLQRLDFLGTPIANLLTESYRLLNSTLKQSSLDISDFRSYLNAVKADIVFKNESAEIAGTKLFWGGFKIAKFAGCNAVESEFQTEPSLFVKSGLELNSEMIPELVTLFITQSDCLKDSDPLFIAGETVLDREAVFAKDLSVGRQPAFVDTDSNQTITSSVLFETKLLADSLSLQHLAGLDFDSFVFLNDSATINTLEFEGEKLTVDSLSVDGDVDGVRFDESFYLSKSSSQVVAGLPLFANVYANASIKTDTVNNLDLDDVVRVDREKSVGGNKVFEQEVEIKNSSDVGERLDSLSIPQDLLLKNSSETQTVFEAKNFTNYGTFETVEVDGEFDGLDLPGDIITLTGAEEIDSSIEFDVGAEFLENIDTESFVDGVKVVELQKDAIGNIEYFESIIFPNQNNTINGIDLRSIKEDVIMEEESETVSLDGKKEFGELEAADCEMEAINKKSLDAFVKSENSETIESNLEFNDLTRFRRMNSERIEEAIPFRDVANFSHQSHADVVALENLQIDLIVLLNGSEINNITSEDFVTNKQPHSIKAFKEFRNLTANELMASSPISAKSLNGITNSELTNLAKNTIKLNGFSNLDASATLLDCLVNNVSVNGFINGDLDIVTFASQVMTLSGNQIISARKDFGLSHVFDEISTHNGINEISLANLDSIAVKLSGRSILFKETEFDDLEVDSIQSHGLVNGVNIEEIALDSVRNNDKLTVVNGKTVFEDGISVKNLEVEKMESERLNLQNSHNFVNRSNFHKILFTNQKWNVLLRNFQEVQEMLGHVWLNDLKTQSIDGYSYRDLELVTSKSSRPPKCQKVSAEELEQMINQMELNSTLQVYSLDPKTIRSVSQINNFEVDHFKREIIYIEDAVASVVSSNLAFTSGCVIEVNSTLVNSDKIHLTTVNDIDIDDLHYRTAKINHSTVFTTMPKFAESVFISTLNLVGDINGVHLEDEVALLNKFQEFTAKVAFEKVLAKNDTLVIGLVNKWNLLNYKHLLSNRSNLNAENVTALDVTASHVNNKPDFVRDLVFLHEPNYPINGLLTFKKSPVFKNAKVKHDIRTAENRVVPLQEVFEHAEALTKLAEFEKTLLEYEDYIDKFYLNEDVIDFFKEAHSNQLLDGTLTQSFEIDSSSLAVDSIRFGNISLLFLLIEDRKFPPCVFTLPYRVNSSSGVFATIDSSSTKHPDNKTVWFARKADGSDYIIESGPSMECSWQKREILQDPFVSVFKLIDVSSESPTEDIFSYPFMFAYDVAILSGLKRGRRNLWMLIVKQNSIIEYFDLKKPTAQPEVVAIGFDKIQAMQHRDVWFVAFVGKKETQLHQFKDGILTRMESFKFTGFQSQFFERNENIYYLTNVEKSLVKSELRLYRLKEFSLYDEKKYDWLEWQNWKTEAVVNMQVVSYRQHNYLFVLHRSLMQILLLGDDSKFQPFSQSNIPKNSRYMHVYEESGDLFVVFAGPTTAVYQVKLRNIQCQKRILI